MFVPCPILLPPFNEPFTCNLQSFCGYINPRPNYFIYFSRSGAIKYLHDGCRRRWWCDLVGVEHFHAVVLIPSGVPRIFCASVLCAWVVVINAFYWWKVARRKRMSQRVGVSGSDLFNLATPLWASQSLKFQVMDVDVCLTGHQFTIDWVWRGYVAVRTVVALNQPTVERERRTGIQTCRSWVSPPICLGLKFFNLRQISQKGEFLRKEKEKEV